MATQILTALPVYNEVNHVERGPGRSAAGTARTCWWSTTARPTARPNCSPGGRTCRWSGTTQPGLRGRTENGLCSTRSPGYDVLVTIDCDGQHQPRMIPDFVAAAAEADIVSGSRYLARFAGDSVPPAERRRINADLTDRTEPPAGPAADRRFLRFQGLSGRGARRISTSTNWATPCRSRFGSRPSTRA